MSNFWPTDIDLEDTQSPMEILNDAQKDWETNSSGVLALVLQTAESKSGHDLIIVHAKHVPSNRTGSLFSVLHRAAIPYPVTILPEGDGIPVILMKSYYQPGSDALGMITPIALRAIEGKTVENEWVADMPSEFRRRLHDMFNTGFVKSVILNLFASDTAAEDPVAAPAEDSTAEEE